MGRIYRSSKTGINVASGKVISIAEDRLSMELATVSYAGGQATEQPTKVCVMQPLSQEFRVGEVASATGYQNGPNSFIAHALTAQEQSGVLNLEDTCVLSGMVKKAVFKPEVNEDGTPIYKKQRLDSEGNPMPLEARKPHFDISIEVPDPEKRKVLHVVKVYNYANPSFEQKTSQIDKMKAIFKNFENPDTTPVYATIVTSIGAERTWENEYNGRVYQNYCCDHIGTHFIDVERLYEDREKVAGQAPAAPAAPQASAPAPAQPAPAAPAAPAQQPVYGEDSSPKFEEVMDEELPFE